MKTTPFKMVFIIREHMKALLLNPADSVAVVLKAVALGENVTFLLEGGEMSVTARHDIPIYHKIAVKRVAKGDSVLKYGEAIGCATEDIDIGNHVHTHNLSDLVPKEED